ncbi:unnamed protein product [Effrenium voratum]|nr:unnamed protein product [Effrenium voratum]CAJ1452077.1 unnamed protein product [Effrenium voratum]
MDGDTRRLSWVESTAASGCDLLRSVLSDMGDMVCCLPALGVARVLPDAVVTGVSRGSVGLTRPPSRCEMLPVASGRYSWRRTKPFPECERSLEVIQDTPLRVLLSPGPEVEADASEDADFVLVDAGEAVEDGTQGSDLTLPGWHLV